MYKLSSIDEVNNELEITDIEDEEYTVWDLEGKPLEFYLDQGEIKIKVCSDKSQLNKLKEAILNYAKKARPKYSFVFTGERSDLVGLFEEVEGFIKKQGIFRRTKRLFTDK
jgi:hypothetical protein